MSEHHSSDVVSLDAVRIAELRREAFYLRELVVAKEVELAGVGATLESFRVRYDLVVGVELARLRELELAIAELASDRDPGDDALRRRVEQLRGDAAQARRAVEDARSSSVVDATDELRRLYRCVCRAVHPDLGVDDDDIAIRQRFMRDAIEAYRVGDADRLQSILDMTVDLSDQEEDTTTVGELARIVDRLAKRIVAIDAELADLRASVMYSIMVKALVEDDVDEYGDPVHDEDAEQRVLGDMAEHVLLQVKDAQRRLEELQ